MMSNEPGEVLRFARFFLELHERLKERFAEGTAALSEPMHRDASRGGKTLAGAAAAGKPASDSEQDPAARSRAAR